MGLLAKNNVDSRFFRKACSFVFVPTFGIFMVCLLTATCIISSISVLNAGKPLSLELQLSVSGVNNFESLVTHRLLLGPK